MSDRWDVNDRWDVDDMRRDAEFSKMNSVCRIACSNESKREDFYLIRLASVNVFEDDVNVFEEWCQCILRWCRRIIILSLLATIHLLINYRAKHTHDLIHDLFQILYNDRVFYEMIKYRLFLWKRRSKNHVDVWNRDFDVFESRNDSW